MDKMMVSGNNDVTISNDGATILKTMNVTHPAAKMLVELSASQDIVAGDGTTSVAVLCGALLDKCIGLLGRGVHPTVISDSMATACDKACEILEAMAIPVDLEDRESLIQAATTSLGSKVVAQYSNLLSPIAVDCVLKVLDSSRPDMIDLRDVKIVKKAGGTIDDTELVEGIVFDQKPSKAAGGPTRVEDAKIGLIQFCVSPPKTDLENNVIVSDYTQMDKILREERNHIIGLIKKIKASGCNVLLVQKSILRDAVSDLALHYLAKAKILVIRDIEREEIEFISKTLHLQPVAHVDSMTPEKLGYAKLVREVQCGNSKIVQVSGIENMGRTVSVVVRGSNKLVVEEADRSLHDALCVIRCLVQKRFLIVGGGAPEIEMSQKLGYWARTLTGMDAVCVKAFAEALEVIPYTLAENAGLNPIEIVTELRNVHTAGNAYHGINVRKGTISDMKDENVLQPMLVTSSALSLATECVRMVLKIDDIIPVAREA
jgi:T-complex protein 1 subunit delta